MPPLVIPNAALLRLVWAKGGTPYAVNVLGVRNATGVSINQETADSLDDAIKAALGTSNLAAAIGDEVTLVSVGIRDIAAPNRPEFVGTGPPAAGTDTTNNLLPPQIAFCVTLRTAAAGKSYRGRVYLTGFSTAANTADGTAATNVGPMSVAFVDAIDQALAAQQLDLAVVSRKALVATVVTLKQARDAVWDTVRNRAKPGI